MNADDALARLREERPFWGALAAGMRCKQALVAEIGVEAAFARAAPELGVPGLQQLRRRTIRPLADAVRVAGRQQVAWPGGATAELPLPAVIGAGNHRPITIRTRTAWFGAVDEVMVRGRSDVLLRGDDELLLDAEGDEYDPAGDNPTYDPAILQADASHAWTMEPAGPARRISQALMLCGAHTPDFGHWLLEYLPRLGLALRCGWRGGMPVLVDKAMPATVRDALARLLPADAPLLPVANFTPCRVGRLWCMANPVYFGFFPSEAAITSHPTHMLTPANIGALLAEIERLADAATTAPTGIQRLFLGRRPERRKLLVNHAEIGIVLARQGFHAVYPEDLDFIEQLRLVRHARHIVAPEGSNSMLNFFARVGARSCVLSPPYTHQLTGVSAIIAARGADPVILTGPDDASSAGHSTSPLWSFWNDYRIDAAACEDFLRGWLDGR